MADYNVLPVVLREFRRAFPLVNLTLRESTTDAQLSDLLAGRIGVGFVLPPINEPSLESLPILREPLLAALPQASAGAQGRQAGTGKTPGRTLHPVSAPLCPGPVRRRGQLLQGRGFQPDLPALRVFVDIASRTANMPRKTRLTA